MASAAGKLNVATTKCNGGQACDPWMNNLHENSPKLAKSLSGWILIGTVMSRECRKGVKISSLCWGQMSKLIQD